MLLSSLVIALIVVLNVLAFYAENTIHLRVDFSRFRIYSLTAVTKGILEGLRDEVDIYSLYSPGAEDYRIQELLGRYAACTSRIHYSNINPLKNPSFASDFDPGNNGIPNNSLIVTDRQRRRYQVLPPTRLYLIDAKTGQVYGMTAEQRITSAINYIETGRVKSIKIVTGNGETPVTSYLSLANILNAMGYDISVYSLLTPSAPLDPKNDTLLIINPGLDLSNDAFDALNRFLQQGGRMLATMQNFAVDEEVGRIRPLSASLPNFNSLFLLFDMNVNRDCILAQDASRFYSPGSASQMRTNLIPDIQPHAITMPILRKGGTVVVNANSSISLSPSTDPALVTTPLLVTDKRCYSKGLINLRTLDKESSDVEGAYVIGALAEKGDAKIALLTSDSFLVDSNVRLASNFDFAVNTISYLSEQEDSISLLPKSLKGDVLEIQSDSQRHFLSFIAVVVMPAAALLCGVLVWLRRRIR